MSPLMVLAKASEVIGYSQKAIRRKIETGVWMEGYEYIRAPDGRILIDIAGFEKWARGEPRELRRA